MDYLYDVFIYYFKFWLHGLGMDRPKNLAGLIKNVLICFSKNLLEQPEVE